MRFPIPKRSDEEIKKLAEEFLAGRIFASTYVMDEDMLVAIFKPLAQLSQEELLDFLNSDVGFLFEYFDPQKNIDKKAMAPRFDTMQIMSVADAIKMAEYVADLLRDKRVKTPSFPLGQIVMTATVANIIADDAGFAAFSAAAMKRHMTGDWGDLGAEDIDRNNQALVHGSRLFSSYKLPNPVGGDDKIWIITEADRSSTTILFPSEY
ncbi:MAG: hypothetical protein WC455_13285 [Dehalococcoidia bacterium]|jgi:hypothetical protein